MRLHPGKSPPADRAQDRLRESEAGLRRAQAMARLAHVVTGPDGSFESWSDTLPQLIGVSAAKMPRDTREWLSLLHPDDHALFRRTAIEAGLKGARADVEYRLRRSDGDWIHVQQTMEPLDGETPANGKRRWFNTLQDVTERRQAEEKIRHLNRVHAVLSGINSMIVRVREREELFREACRIAVEAGGFKLAWIGIFSPGAGDIDVVCWHGDGDGYIERMPLGQGRNTLGRRNLSMQAISERRTKISADMANDPQILLKKESAERGFQSLAILPLLAPEGPIGVLALYAGETGFFDAEEVKLLEELAGDITYAFEHIDLDQRVKLRTAELIRALEGLRRSEAELEQRVRQRTAELESANDELEAFSYSVSHDLRAPLRHIDGFAQMLREDCAPVLDATGMRYLDVITESVKQMGQLIDDLLLFSRMGRVEMHQAEVSMDALVAEVLKLQEGEIGGRAVEWSVEPLPAVLGDRAMLRQVWANLLGNAVKYTRTCALAKIGIGYDRATGEFHVRDNGAGFDMAYADKLFGVFQRLHRTEEFEGTGVGLANVRRIITRHGGRIRAEGKVNEGATFHFSLPLHQGSAR
jgi:PAS domain S-box-containing protein